MPNPAEETFEQALESLETIVHDLEDGQIGLAESLAKYEHGVKLLKQCYELLTRAERRIEMLSRVEPGGAAITEPFDDSPTAAQTPTETQATPKRRRRSVPTEPPAPTTSADSSDPVQPSAIDVPRSLF